MKVWTSNYRREADQHKKDLDLDVSGVAKSYVLLIIWLSGEDSLPSWMESL